MENHTLEDHRVLAVVIHVVVVAHMVMAHVVARVVGRGGRGLGRLRAGGNGTQSDETR